MPSYEFIYLGSTPANEKPLPVGDPGVWDECQRWRRQLEKKFGASKPETCSFRIMREAHEFGSYYEVAIRFDPSDRRALDWAYEVESNLPTEWVTP
jgi:hypothetical protein